MIDNVSALFVSEKSVYKSLVSDCYDFKRNALNFFGINPVICHPPCRSWGRLSHMCNFDINEHNLAYFAIDLIRAYGGVLEHPSGSKLWPNVLPLPGLTDDYGGFSISIDQFWFGHKAKKNTMLYICGCQFKDIPSIPLRFESIEFVVAKSNFHKKSVRSRPEVSKKERSDTPILFAKWLISIAQMCTRVA
jgi:hypothetical protein